MIMQTSRSKCGALPCPLFSCVSRDPSLSCQLEVVYTVGVLSRALCCVGLPLRPRLSPIFCSACASCPLRCFDSHDLLISICTSVQAMANPAAESA